MSPRRLTPAEVIDRRMTGGQLNEILIHAGLLHGWLVNHNRPCQNARGQWSTPLQGTPGAPDLLFVREPEILFWETKRQVGEVVSPVQERWADHLTWIARWSSSAQGAPVIEYRVVRPSDRAWAVARLSRPRPFGHAAAGALSG